MNAISRRSALRVVGGAAGTAGLVGGSLAVPSLLPSSSAARGPKKIRARLNRDTFSPGDRMVLRLREDLRPGRRVRLVDTTGLKWTRIRKTQNRQVWTATARQAGRGTVRVEVRWPDGRRVLDKRYRDKVRYQVLRGASGAPLIGMSAPADVWHQRVAEVGGGLAARRIFADLGSGATSQLNLVEQAHAAGLLPVISYKVGRDVAGAASGRFDAVAAQAADRLAAFGLPTAVTFWHEPYGDMSGAEYIAASKRLLPFFKRGELRVGPLLNGWLLDRQVSTFASFTDDELFELWDWFGIDTYESGTMGSPGEVKPAHRIPAMASFLESRGHGDMPMGVGEYNGYSAQTIASAGEALMSTPNVWFGCMWNATEGKGVTLAGERLAAFRATLADPRSADPRSG